MPEVMFNFCSYRLNDCDLLNITGVRESQIHCVLNISQSSQLVGVKVCVLLKCICLISLFVLSFSLHILFGGGGGGCCCCCFSCCWEGVHGEKR